MMKAPFLGIGIIICNDAPAYNYYMAGMLFCDYKFLPWQFLNFLPLPHGHGSLGRGIRSAR